jgi:SAM-dependent methyltransferase
MEAYTDFATVYDTFMDETPYDVWGNFVAKLIEKYGVSKPLGASAASGSVSDIQVDAGEIGDETYDEQTGSGETTGETDEAAALDEERNLVVELGCGTGSFTQIMKKKGYDMIGIDMSPDMLNVARNKAASEGLDIMYLEQDMRELDLYCTAGTIVSVCDSVNYVLEDDELLETFRLVNNFLFPGGVFIFDFNTLHKYRDVIGDATIAENRDDCSFIWDNYFHDEENINEYDLTIFVRCNEGKELFQRFTETHYQRGYTLEEMKMLVERSGMVFVTAIDADTHEEPSEDSERIYIVARENGKQSL